MKPLIGIPSARVYNKDRPYSPYVYGQMHTYVEAAEQAGGIAIILPLGDSIDEQLFRTLDGILLAGGQDITPALYGQETTYSEDLDTNRDEYEMTLIQLAEQTGTPVLGICRGMQLMNIARGGISYQDLIKEREGSSNHDGYLEVKSTEHLAHELSVDSQSKLSSILGVTTIKSNTHHHQGINHVGSGFTVNATTPDGVIEGIEDSSKPFFLGVQCHPESIFQRAEPRWSKLFQAFIASAKAYRESK